MYFIGGLNLKNKKELRKFLKMIKTENNFIQRNKIFFFSKALDKFKNKKQKYYIKTDINTNK